ncbi:purine-nucleoside phosphorylase [bacterium]|nr:purine-nucleoside phosphorylase [bacterium]
MSSLLQSINESVQFIRTKTKTEPSVGIILGTGLGALVKDIQIEKEIPYQEIPHFPVSTVESHAGKLIFGKLGGKNVVAMQGRFHFYEGYTMQQITFPVRVMKFLGIKTLLVSNACGGMNPQYQPGDIMIMDDHINLLGDNPLRGKNEDTLGPRFPDMSEPYSQKLIALAEHIALEEKIKVQKGVYVAVMGPNLETRAEYRFLRFIGADVVGMSTVPEVIVATHMGIPSLGFSIVTDECFPDSLKPVDIQKIIKTAGEAEPKMTLIMKRVVEKL